MLIVFAPVGGWVQEDWASNSFEVFGAYFWLHQLEGSISFMERVKALWNYL